MKRDPNREFFKGLGRAAGGAVLFTVPLLMTMEMWFLGVSMHPLRLALLVVLSIPLLAGLAFHSGFEERLSLRGVVVDAFVAFAVGVVTSATILSLLGILTWQLTPAEMVGKITLQAIPAGMGAVLASSLMGTNKIEPAGRGHSGYWRELFLMLAGALFFSFNLAPTDEMVVIAHAMSAWHTVLIVLLSLAILHIFVYKLDFRGQETHPESHPWWAVFARFTISGYAIALIISFLCMWLFGRNDGNSATTVVTQTVVLGFPSAIGAATARLLL